MESWGIENLENCSSAAAVENRKKNAATVSYPHSQLSSTVEQGSTHWQCIIFVQKRFDPNRMLSGSGPSEEVTFWPGRSARDLSAGVSESKMLHFGPAAGPVISPPAGPRARALQPPCGPELGTIQVHMPHSVRRAGGPPTSTEVGPRQCYILHKTFYVQYNVVATDGHQWPHSK